MTKYHQAPDGLRRCQEKVGQCPYGGPVGFTGASGQSYVSMREKWMEETIAVEREAKAIEAERRFVSFSDTEARLAKEELTKEEYRMYLADKEVWNYTNGRGTDEEVNRQILYVRSMSHNNFFSLAKEMNQVKRVGRIDLLKAVVRKHYQRAKGIDVYVKEAEVVSPIQHSDDTLANDFEYFKKFGKLPETSKGKSMRDQVAEGDLNDKMRQDFLRVIDENKSVKNVDVKSWDSERNCYSRPFNSFVEASSYGKGLKNEKRVKFNRLMDRFYDECPDALNDVMRSRAHYGSDESFREALIVRADNELEWSAANKRRLSLIDKGGSEMEVRYLNDVAPERLDAILEHGGSDVVNEVSVSYTNYLRKASERRVELNKREQSSNWGRIANSMAALYQKMIHIRQFFSDGGLLEGNKPSRGQTVSNKWVYSSGLFYRKQLPSEQEMRRQILELKNKKYLQ